MDVLRYALLIAPALLWCGTAEAQVTSTVTGELQVKLLVTASCEVSGSSTGSIGTALLDFGSTTLLLEAIDADTGTSGVDALEVLCNPGVSYSIDFNAGQHAAAIADRAMQLEGGTELVRYQIYSDAARANVLSTLSGVGTGTPEAIQVFGRVPPQAAPTPGTYRDVVTVTVSF
jgi:spore coat protein U-like protein